MRFFSKIIEEEEYDIYSLKKYVNKKFIALIIIMIIIIFITLTASLYYILNTKKRIEISKKFENEIIDYAYEQEEIIRKAEEERLAKIPQLTEEGKENLNNIYSVESKKAYLTFDDGPSNNTIDILNILNENNIKATFFVLGKQVEYFPETTKKIYNEGHYIANHGYSHVYSQIYTSPQTVLEEFTLCNQIVANTIGVPEYNSHLFRFPGGLPGGKYTSIKEEAANLLEENNIMHIDWNSLTGDAEKAEPSEEYLINNLQRTTEGKNNLVILMHDSAAKRITVETLPEVIQYLSEQGYEFDNFYNIIK